MKGTMIFKMLYDYVMLFIMEFCCILSTISLFSLSWYTFNLYGLINLFYLFVSLGILFLYESFALIILWTKEKKEKYHF